MLFRLIDDVCFTTDPILFMLSLVQQCKLSPKLAYGVIAGFRFLPLLKDEVQLIQQAHKIRGGAAENGFKEKISALKRYTIRFWQVPSEKRNGRRLRWNRKVLQEAEIGHITGR